MKQKYSNVTLSSGHYRAGICQIKIAPKEWLLDPVIIDFNTNIVNHEVLLKPDFNFLTLDFTPDSYEFDEKPKSSRGGSYFEVTLQGMVNNITPDILATLETFRYHEMVAIIKDKNKRMKVVGDQDAGLIFRFTNKESSNQGGVQQCAVDLTMDAEKLSPFYEI